MLTGQVDHLAEQDCPDSFVCIPAPCVIPFPILTSVGRQDKWTTFFEEHGHQLTSDWRPWTTDGGRRLVGYTMQFEGGWTYATIRGAGHMVRTGRWVQGPGFCGPGLGYSIWGLDVFAR